MMQRVYQMLARVRALFSRTQLDRDLDEELSAHLRLLTEEHMTQGMDLATARREAKLRMGSMDGARELHRETRAIPEVDNLLRDVRYAVRQFCKNSTFTIVAVLTLAIGIGGNTAMFSVIRGVLLKPLPYHDPDRLVYLARHNSQQSLQERPIPAWRLGPVMAAQSFLNMGAFLATPEEVTFSGNEAPEVLRGARVSGNFLEILGVRPALGRVFLAEEDAAGAAPVAMISYTFWKRRFAGDISLTGKTVILNSVPYTIIGVLPDGFAFPFTDVDVWVTRPSEWSGLEPRNWGSTPLIVFGRLKPESTLEQARAEISVLNQQHLTAFPASPDAADGVTIRVMLLKDRLVANVRQMLWVLSGAVGFVLLIACANVASLLMARATSRSSEFAVRTAVGASRWQLVRQLLAESLVLGCGGGAFGWLLGKLALSAIASMSVFDLPRAAEINMDGPVLGFALALSVVTSVLFGVFPAFQISRADLSGALRISGAGSTSGSPRNRGLFGAPSRGLLVVTQVALAMILLIGATLMIRSLAQLRSVDPGFQTEDLMTLKIPLPTAQYNTPEKRAAFFGELARRVETLSGVRGAAAVLFLPTTGALGTNIYIQEQPSPGPTGHQGTQLQSITPGYFQTFGIPLRRGRDLMPPDNTPGAQPVVIINESFARRFWPAYPDGPDPVGHHLRAGIIASIGYVQIVGIVADVHHSGLAAEMNPQVFYVPNILYPPQTAYLAVRTDGNPLRFIDAIRSEVRAIDRGQPISEVRMMDEIFEESVGQRRLAMLLLGVFAGAALLLANVGIYGMLAYAVAQRTQEIGIRRALGARQSDILRTVLGQAFFWVFAGVVLGVVGAVALTRFLSGLLFRVTATDPATFIAVPVLFVVVAMAASYLPARRAGHVDPLRALRNQ